MSTTGEQIIEALEEVLADTKGTETGVLRHMVAVPHDGSGVGSDATSGTSSIDEGEPSKRRRA